ncbi:testis-expressed protein 26 isoform X1 [Scyliorhinus torazame]|uniref:testis-expressed protein 26 isoform X1 n=1 Tax=Scyliorhinus torazame TaxID=75743 RepID=UPI003B5CC18F
MSAPDAPETCERMPAPGRTQMWTWRNGTWGISQAIGEPRVVRLWTACYPGTSAATGHLGTASFYLDTSIWNGRGIARLPGWQCQGAWLPVPGSGPGCPALLRWGKGRSRTPEHTGSSNGYTFPFQLHEPIGNTTYKNDYAWNTSSSQQPMPRGMSAQHKDDAIQKCKCLLLWKLLLEDPEAYHRVKTCFMKSLSSEDMQKVRACQFDTIYRQDYLGVQQESLKCPPCLPNIRRPDEQSPPFTDKQHRSRKQTQKPGTAVCTTRYGSNKHWDIAAKGIVPSVTQAHIRNQESRKQPTTYAREYGNFNLDFSKILKSLEPKAMQSYLASLPIKDQEVMLQFLGNMATGSKTN